MIISTEHPRQLCEVNKLAGERVEQGPRGGRMKGMGVLSSVIMLGQRRQPSDP